MFPSKPSIAIFDSPRVTLHVVAPARPPQRSTCCRAPRGSFDRPAGAAGLCLQQSVINGDLMVI